MEAAPDLRMETPSFRVFAATLLSLGILAEPISGQQSASASHATADGVAVFTQRVDAYLKLRDDQAKNTPPLKKTDNPADISAAQKDVAQRVRSARATARQGDVFTPEVQTVFRRLLSPAVKGADGQDNAKAIKEDAPDPKEVPFKVNAEYPRELPLSTVPPDVLAKLPALPKDKDLFYRFTGKHLLLHDARANLIVDFMLNALP
jgi:hypothetical protein